MGLLVVIFQDEAAEEGDRQKAKHPVSRYLSESKPGNSPRLTVAALNIQVMYREPNLEPESPASVRAPKDPQDWSK